MTGAKRPPLGINAQNNEITGVPYDAYGNVTQLPPTSTTLADDVANLITSVNGTQVYAYGQSNRRVWYRIPGQAEFLYLYVNGKKLATYTLTIPTVRLYQ
jgi:hypothetical protein